MKKTLIAGLFVVSMFAGLYADSTEDAQFQQFVQLSKEDKNNPQGMTISSDSTYRIIYAALPIAINYAQATPANIAKMKKGMLDAIRTPEMKAQCKAIKDLKISFVYTFITTDKKIFSIPLSYQEL